MKLLDTENQIEGTRSPEPISCCSKIISELKKDSYNRQRLLDDKKSLLETDFFLSPTALDFKGSANSESLCHPQDTIDMELRAQMELAPGESK